MKLKSILESNVGPIDHIPPWTVDQAIRYMPWGYKEMISSDLTRSKNGMVMRNELSPEIKAEKQEWLNRDWKKFQDELREINPKNLKTIYGNLDIAKRYLATHNLQIPGMFKNGQPIKMSKPLTFTTHDRQRSGFNKDGSSPFNLAKNPNTPTKRSHLKVIK